MFGFGSSKGKVERRLAEVQKKVDPSQDRSKMSMSKVNDMGMAAMGYDSANNEYQNSAKGRADRKRVMSALKGVERDVRKSGK